MRMCHESRNARSIGINAAAQTESPTPRLSTDVLQMSSKDVERTLASVDYRQLNTLILLRTLPESSLGSGVRSSESHWRMVTAETLCKGGGRTGGDGMVVD